MPGILLAGSRVRVGLVLKNGNNGFFYEDQQILNDVIPTLEGCLYQTGQFQDLRFDYNDGGFFSNDYLNVQAETVLDFDEADHFAGLVLETIQLCLPGLFPTIVRQDPVIIDDVPKAARGRQDVQQVNAERVIPLGPAPQAPGRCEGLPALDYLACQTGLSSSTLGLGIPVLAIGGLIVLLLVLRR